MTIAARKFKFSLYRVKSWSVLLVAFVAYGCASHSHQRGAITAFRSDDKPLVNGDRILIYGGCGWYGKMPRTIDSNGEIDLQLLGRVFVAGLTATQAEKKINGQYILSGYYSRVDMHVERVEN